MAELTTSTGEEIAFDPAAITAVAERDADTGEVCTTVYGLSAAPLRLEEHPRALLARLQLSTHFAELTRPDGSAVWISGPAVTSLRPPSPDEYEPNVQSVIVAGLLTQGVEERPEEARTRLNDAHATL